MRIYWEITKKKKPVYECHIQNPPKKGHKCPLGLLKCHYTKSQATSSLLSQLVTDRSNAGQNDTRYSNLCITIFSAQDNQILSKMSQGDKISHKLLKFTKRKAMQLSAMVKPQDFSCMEIITCRTLSTCDCITCLNYFTSSLKQHREVCAANLRLQTRPRNVKNVITFTQLISMRTRISAEVGLIVHPLLSSSSPPCLSQQLV